MAEEPSLRDVHPADLDLFFAHQADPEASRMAARASRERPAFVAHWAKILPDPTVIKQTILWRGTVVGYVVTWASGDSRFLGYWLGRAHWGHGIASDAVLQFLQKNTTRPLVAHVAKHNRASIRILEKAGFSFEREFWDDEIAILVMHLDA